MAAAPVAERLMVEVVADYPHEAGWYTQGLVVWRDEIFESFGGYGRSGLVRYAFGGEAPLRQIRLDDDLFAEGLERVDDRLIQLTWRSGRVLTWDLETFEPLGEHRLQGEGWGLAYDGEVLWVSNGTHLLSAHDPQTFERLRRIAVMRDGAPQTLLNELEWVDGVLFANVYETDEIVRIDVEQARVTAVIDAAGLLTAKEVAGAEVLNGIAYRPNEQTFLLTGKFWPRLFEVRFVSADPTRQR